jgi:hypothetical protein
MALEGTLQDMSLPDLFQVFRMGPKTGVLLLVGGPERGVIYTAEGRPVDAAVVRGAERAVVATHDDAVIHMLLWEDASFVFRHDPAIRERPVRIVHDAEWLVMEGMRRRDDPTRALPYHRITLETQLQLSPLPSSAESGVSLDVNQWRILSQVSSCPSLRLICEATGITPEQATRIVAELLAIGLVEIVPPAPPPPRPRPASQSLAPGHTSALMGMAVPALAGGVDPAQPAGRGLLDAIMRRIRGL